MNLNGIDIRDSFFDQLYLKGSTNKNIIILSADMDAFSLRKFSKDFPNQYINVGVSEQNMINVASGLAMSGKIVFCYSIASFATLRCFEQIKVNICSMNLPVTIVGAGAGFSFGYDGPTHHGHQDLSSMKLLPEMSIFELSSNDLAKKCIDFSIEKKSPLYIRLDKGPFPDLSSFKVDFSKGYRILKPLENINLISNGFMIRKAINVVNTLKSLGVNCGLIDLFNVKPFPKNLYKDIILNSKKIITLEESCVSGGLGSSVSDIISVNSNKCQLQIIGAPNKQFIEYGDRNWFLDKYNLSEEGIVKSIYENI